MPLPLVQKEGWHLLHGDGALSCISCALLDRTVGYIRPIQLSLVSMAELTEPLQLLLELCLGQKINCC